MRLASISNYRQLNLSNIIKYQMGNHGFPELEARQVSDNFSANSLDLTDGLEISRTEEVEQ